MSDIPSNLTYKEGNGISEQTFNVLQGQIDLLNENINRITGNRTEEYGEMNNKLYDIYNSIKIEQRTEGK